MEIIICIIFFLGIAIIYSTITSRKDEARSIEEIQEEEKGKELIKKEFFQQYKKKSKKEIEKELKKIEEDYNNLITLARKKYEEQNGVDNAIEIDYRNNLVDRSYDYRYSINYALAVKYEILNRILEENLYSEEPIMEEYTILGHLKYNNSDGVEKKTRYSAKIVFDIDESERIGFLYSNAIKKKRKDLGKMAVLLYSYIEKIKVEDDKIIMYISHAKTMKKYIDNALTIDNKIENNIIIVTFETETPNEICKKINKRIKKK